LAIVNLIIFFVAKQKALLLAHSSGAAADI